MSELLINGNALSIPLADQSVQCVVTSPPYYGLRDYGTATWIGDDPECDHKIDNSKGVATSTLVGSKRNVSNALAGYKNACAKCGAIRVDNQLGLEPTPEAYVENMVAVFRELWRVLRDDGTAWLNIGDSYSGSGKGDNSNGKQGTNKGTRFDSPTSGYISNGLKPKDLIGIPWRVAFALQADGWYLRSDIIWHKPNTMPESVTDRPTKAHEYIFLLTKNARYYYDHEAIMEPIAREWDDKNIGNKNRINTGAMTGIVLGREKDPHCGLANTLPNPKGRNKRSVWTVTTKPYRGAHFATYPPDLIVDCIKAGSKEGDVVFDPFAGSGTTLIVARKLKRHAIGLDLSMDYLTNNARERLGYNVLDKWTQNKPIGMTSESEPLFEVNNA